MFIQVAMCSFSSPACVSLTLGYSEDSTSTLSVQFQVICWLHLQSTELCEVPDNRLLRGRTVIISYKIAHYSALLPTLAHGCRARKGCAVLRRSNQNPNMMAE